MDQGQPDFERPFGELQAHLVEVMPTFDSFCARHSYSYASRSSIGRYPRIRVGKTVEGVNFWFDLWMELDEDGRRFETYSPTLFYELSCGAFLDLYETTGAGIRYSKKVLCFAGKPFNEVPAILETILEKYLPVIEAWDASYLKEYGEVSPVSALPID